MGQSRRLAQRRLSSGNVAVHFAVAISESADTSSAVQAVTDSVQALSIDLNLGTDLATTVNAATSGDFEITVSEVSDATVTESEGDDGDGTNTGGTNTGGDGTNAADVSRAVRTRCLAG